MHRVRSMTFRRGLLVLAILPFALLALGCGSKEEAKSGGSYYEGPMKAKGAPDKTSSGN